MEKPLSTVWAERLSADLATASVLTGWVRSLRCQWSLSQRPWRRPLQCGQRLLPAIAVGWAITTQLFGVKFWNPAMLSLAALLLAFFGVGGGSDSRTTGREP